ncbi:MULTISPECIES: hypothetical protein [Acinetobacter]|uniref:hypothetical protein n=1 Tax=Acinetobacter TaxID=469 RepID=UPI00103E931C|nr:hypothetical protein [Acinetobacter sp. ANC 3781]TCB74380.1 hypothetical protein E0H89_12665 [Acinetobacter sp. ANC 3781]
MEIYKDIDNDSNVTHFEIGSTYITVWFQGTARSYTYSYYKAGQFHIEKMKVLAKSGNGLNSYIMRNVKKLYD